MDAAHRELSETLLIVGLGNGFDNVLNRTVAEGSARDRESPRAVNQGAIKGDRLSRVGLAVSDRLAVLVLHRVVIAELLALVGRVNDQKGGGRGRAVATPNERGSVIGRSVRHKGGGFLTAKI